MKSLLKNPTNVQQRPISNRARGGAVKPFPPRNMASGPFKRSLEGNKCLVTYAARLNSIVLLTPTWLLQTPPKRGIAIQIDQFVCSIGCLLRKPKSWTFPWLGTSPHDSGYHQNRVATQFIKTRKINRDSGYGSQKYSKGKVLGTPLCPVVRLAHNRST